jgi:hypothetical protein
MRNGVIYYYTEREKCLLCVQSAPDFFVDNSDAYPLHAFQIPAPLFETRRTFGIASQNNMPFAVWTRQRRACRPEYRYDRDIESGGDMHRS